MYYTMHVVEGWAPGSGMEGGQLVTVPAQAGLATLAGIIVVSKRHHRNSTHPRQAFDDSHT